VPDIQAAWNLAARRGIPKERQSQIHIGRNKHRLFGLFDPDGSRIEVQEPKPVE
jgi:hypothetical protein